VNADKFCFVFEGEGGFLGKFIEMYIDISQKFEYFFVVIRAVATNNEILDAYVKDYKEMEKKHPVEPYLFKNVSKYFVSRQHFKPYDEKVAEHFATKRQGKYVGQFIKVPDQPDK
jgi:hypothetical protein